MRPQSYLSTLQTHARTHVDFSSRHGVPCLLYRSDDATASCWSQMFHSEEAARVTWIWMPTWEAHNGTENVKRKKQRGPFPCLTTVLRILMIIATSDIFSSLFVQHHLDWRWFTARSAPFARSQVFCRVYFNSLPFVWLRLIRHASGAAGARLCVHVGGVWRPPLCLGKMAFPEEHVGDIKSCDLAAPALWSCSSACSSLQ